MLLPVVLQGDPGRRLKDLEDAFPGLGRALEIQERFDSLGHRSALFTFHSTFVIALEPPSSLRVVSQVHLVANEHYGHVRTEVLDFGAPLFVDIL